MLKVAMREWEKYTCIRFHEAGPSDSNYIYFQDGLGYVYIRNYLSCIDNKYATLTTRYSLYILCISDIGDKTKCDRINSACITEPKKHENSLIINLLTKSHDFSLPLLIFLSFVLLRSQYWYVPVTDSSFRCFRYICNSDIMNMKHENCFN